MLEQLFSKMSHSDKMLLIFIILIIGLALFMLLVCMLREVNQQISFERQKLIKSQEAQKKVKLAYTWYLQTRNCKRKRGRSKWQTSKEKRQ